MKPLEAMALKLRELERRIETLEARERLLAWVLATEDVALINAGSAGATQQDWIEITVDGNTAYIRCYASK